MNMKGMTTENYHALTDPEENYMLMIRILKDALIETNGIEKAEAIESLPDARIFCLAGMCSDMCDCGKHSTMDGWGMPTHLDLHS